MSVFAGGGETTEEDVAIYGTYAEVIDKAMERLLTGEYNPRTVLEYLVWDVCRAERGDEC